MKDLNTTLREDYSQKLDTLKFSDKRKLYKLYEEPKHTSALKRITAFHIVMATLIVAFTVSATAVGYTLHDAIFEKTADLNISDEKREDMVSRLEAIANASPDMVNSDSEIKVNKYGETYGKLSDYVDLVGVGGYDEKDNKISGYCYYEDFYCAQGLDFRFDGVDKFDEYRRYAYIFDENGENILGVYRPGTTVGGDDFWTFEELENTDWFSHISDTESFINYTERVQKQIEERTGKRAENIP